MVFIVLDIMVLQGPLVLHTFESMITQMQSIKSNQVSPSSIHFPSLPYACIL